MMKKKLILGAFAGKNASKHRFSAHDFEMKIGLSAYREVLCYCK
jgi:hypothetical protein